MVREGFLGQCCLSELSDTNWSQDSHGTQGNGGRWPLFSHLRIGVAALQYLVGSKWLPALQTAGAHRATGKAGTWSICK